MLVTENINDSHIQTPQVLERDEEATSTKLQASSPKRIKLQAASLKPQAQSFKLQAGSHKLADHGPWIKFHGPRTKALDQDKTILRMCYVEGNLVW